jgi:soluble lytic murein transglycosylase
MRPCAFVSTLYPPLAMVLLVASTGARAAPSAPDTAADTATTPTTAAPAAAAPAFDVRVAFREALDKASTSRHPPDPHALRTYVLYPYVEAARLRSALGRVRKGARDASLEAAILAFLQRHGDEPVTRELKRDRLLFLGERAAWAEFQAEAPPDVAERGEPLALQCYALLARLARLARKPDDDLRELAVEAWLAAPSTPPACAPLVQWLDSPDHLADADIERRAIYAAQYQVALPKALAALPAPRRDLVQLWWRLMGTPEHELRRFAEAPEAKAAREDVEVGAALLETFVRLSRKNSAKAREVYPLLARLPQFTAAQRIELKRALALGLAYDREREALKWFAEIPDDVLDGPTREWRVRAALLHGEWKIARQWLEQMPEPQKSEPRWRYWLGRALDHGLHPIRAREMYEHAATGREYYAFLAAERLGRAPVLRPVALADDKPVQSELVARPAMARAYELFLCDRAELGAAELRYALRNDPPAVRAQAARVLDAWGWHLPAVQILSEQQMWDDLWLRFPMPWEAEVENAARAAGIPGEWVYSVLRTESLYDPRAVSPAGALGLLQLMPLTARRVAMHSRLRPPKREELFQPDVNLALGARYLGELYDRFGKRLPLALAAYNAGPVRVPEWLRTIPVEGDIWIENIPYNETRQYVQRALSSLVITGWRRDGAPRPLLPLLQPVALPGEHGPP